MSRLITRPLAVFLLLGIAHQRCLAEDVVETYETGQKKAEYQVKNGKRFGEYTEYYLGGQIRVKARYKSGRLEGDYIVYHGDGKKHIHIQYKRGVRHGPYIETDKKGKLIATGKYHRGKLDGLYKTYTRGKTDQVHELDEGELVRYRGRQVHPRTLDEMTREFQQIFSATAKFESATAEQLAALHRLNAYRYLSGVPANVELDEERCDGAQEEADYLAHSKPDEIVLAEGANLAAQVTEEIESPTMAAGVDTLMADRVDSYENGLAMRRQCLDLKMGQVGLGRVDRYVVMSKDDRSRMKTPDWEVIAHPAPGYTPVDYFSADRPWMVIVNHQLFKSILKVKSVQVQRIQDNLTLSKPIELEHKSEIVLDEMEPDARPDHVFLFYPQGIEVAAGARYWVQITGFQRKSGDLRSVAFLVEFTEPIDLTKKTKKSKRKKSTRKKR